jgi:hypothetical protein
MNLWIERLDEGTLTELLGDLMSSISEDCYYAGWEKGTEYIVPALCTRVANLNRSQFWAHGQVGTGLADILLSIAEKLGHWVNLNDNASGYVLFDPWPTPQEYVEELNYWQTYWKNEKASHHVE